MYAYIDETGNAGIFDSDQPIFITAALMTKTNFDLLYAQDLKIIASKISETELHANKLGSEKVEQIAENLLKLFKKCDASFFISRVEKKYLIVTKFVDTLFDPLKNKSVPPHIYHLRGSRLFLTYKIAINLNEDIAKKFWLSLMEKKAAKAQEMFLESLSDLEQDILNISDNCLKQLVSDAIRWVKQNPESISIYSAKSVKLGHLPNMIGFSNLLRGIDKRSEKWKIKVAEIVHDRQSQFATTLIEWHGIHKNFPTDVIYCMGEERKLRYVEGSKFRISASADSPGIQTIDIVIWLYKRFLDGKLHGYHSVRLINYVLKHAYQSDFSFKSIEEELNQYSSTKKTPTDDELKKAKDFLAIEKEYVKEEMLKYELRTKSDN